MIDESMRFAEAVAQWELASRDWAHDAAGCETPEEAESAVPYLGPVLWEIGNAEPEKARAKAEAFLDEPGLLDEILEDIPEVGA